MKKPSGSKYAPLFTPAVARVYRGMLVEVPLQLCAMSNAPSLEAIRDTLAFAYEGSKQIHVADKASCEALGRMEIEQVGATDRLDIRSEEHTSELQSLMRISYAVFCLKKKNKIKNTNTKSTPTTYEHKREYNQRNRTSDTQHKT